MNEVLALRRLPIHVLRRIRSGPEFPFIVFVLEFRKFLLHISCRPPFAPVHVPGRNHSYELPPRREDYKQPPAGTGLTEGVVSPPGLSFPVCCRLLLQLAELGDYESL